MTGAAALAVLLFSVSAGRAQSRVLGILEVPEPGRWQSAEFDYERSGALVYGMKADGRYLVRPAKEGKERWLAADEERFHPYLELLKGMAYPTELWDGVLRDGPGTEQGKLVTGPRFAGELTLPEPARRGNKSGVTEIGTMLRLRAEPSEEAEEITGFWDTDLGERVRTPAGAGRTIPVLEERGGWYKLLLGDDTEGWLKPPMEIVRYVALDRARGESLWDRAHRRDPRPSHTAEVLESLQIGHDLWLRVSLVEGCAGEPVAAGWLPAYAPNGRAVVWFHSRGC